jgi:hypothetical protein
MATHRAKTLLAILPKALETGYAEAFSERESLKVRFIIEDLRLLCTKLRITEF